MTNAPLVVCVAPTGARRSKSDHAALPLTAQEIVQEAQRCAAAGARALHLHVRDASGAHTLDPLHYQRVLPLLREHAAELLIQVTTEALGRYSAQEQRAVVRALMPEAVSVALREMLPAGNGKDDARAFYHWARDASIAVQHILYSIEDVNRLIALAESGCIPAPAAALFVLGRDSGASGWRPRELVEWLYRWPPEWPWMVCGFGWQQAPLSTAAIGLGGHARVGFENALQLPDGSLARDNAQGVALCLQGAAAAGRPLANRHETRRVLGGPV